MYNLNRLSTSLSSNGGIRTIKTMPCTAWTLVYQCGFSGITCRSVGSTFLREVTLSGVVALKCFLEIAHLEIWIIFLKKTL